MSIVYGYNKWVVLSLLDSKYPKFMILLKWLCDICIESDDLLLYMW